MQAVHVHETKTGEKIECYGDLCEDSNFYILCENEEADGIWANGVPTKYSEKGWRANEEWEPTAHWSRVCNFLLTNYRGDIVEISAV